MDTLYFQGNKYGVGWRAYSSLLIILLFCLFFLLPSSPLKAWEYSLGEEDWGPTCFVKQKHPNGEITILSSQNNFNPALLISLPKYPKNPQKIAIRFHLNTGVDFKLTGAVDDYFGEIYLKINRSHIDSFIKGQSLNITFEDTSPITVSLKGSSKALNAFLRCARTPPKAPVAAPVPPAVTTAPVRPRVTGPVSPPVTAPPHPTLPRWTGMNNRIIPQLVGKYVRSPAENDWHTGSITLVGKQLFWNNKAGVSWKLYLDPANRNVVNTGQDNPYHAKYPNARSFRLIGRNGRITGFVFGGSTYSRQGAGDSAVSCAGDPLGGMRLLAGFRHQPLQGIDSITGKVEKPGGLRISYEIGLVYPPGAIRTGGSFQDRPKLTPGPDLRWYLEQTVSGQPVHIAYRHDNILLLSYPQKGMNMNAVIRTPSEMAEAMLMMLTYAGPATGCR